jgi:hypothetical protein
LFCFLSFFCARLKFACCAVIVVAIGRNKPLKRQKPSWRAEFPMTDGQLRSKRDEFWDTAPVFEGRREIWDAVRVAAEAVENADYELAQAIVDGANISLPKGELTECYDELGNRYVIPNYCLSRPVNMQSENDAIDCPDSPEQTDTKQESDKPKQNKKPKNAAGVQEQEQGTLNRVPLKLRLSSGQELKLHFQPKETIADVKRKIEEREGISVSRQRLFCSGQLLIDKRTIQNCSIPKGFVVQVIVSPET